MTRSIAMRVNAAAMLHVAAESLRSRRPVLPGDIVRYFYYHHDKDGGPNTRVVQGTGAVEFVHGKEPSIEIEGHPRRLFRREVAHMGKKSA